MLADKKKAALKEQSFKNVKLPWPTMWLDYHSGRAKEWKELLLNT